MTSQKDVKKLIRNLQEQGFQVTRVRAGHWHVRDADGKLIGTLPSTPSEYRGLKNQLARLRRSGYRDPERAR